MHVEGHGDIIYGGEALKKRCDPGQSLFLRYRRPLNPVHQPSAASVLIGGQQVDALLNYELYRATMIPARRASNHRSDAMAVVGRRGTLRLNPPGYLSGGVVGYGDPQGRRRRATQPTILFAP
jgi:hypothetical protein